MITKNLSKVKNFNKQKRLFKRDFNEFDLVKWKNPFKSQPTIVTQRDPFEKFQNELMQWSNELFKFPKFSSEFYEKSMIEIDIKEKKNSYQIQADLPGIEKNDIKVQIENGSLKITGERKTELEEKDENYLRSEKYYGKLERVLTLPENADGENMKAEYKNGVLHLNIPKKESKVTTGKVIEIK